MRRDVQVAELVRAEPERGEHGRIELAHGPLAEHVDRVIERSHSLHRSVRKPLSERALAVVEALGRAAERAIRIRVVLEDPAHDGVRRTPCRRDGHRFSATT